MDWKLVAAKLASAGLPLLAKIIGGEIERIPIVGSFIDGPDVIMRIGRQAIALALGVDPTPEAIGKAIDEKPTSEVLPTLQGVENGLAEKYQMQTEVAKSDNVAEVEIARINAESYARTINATNVATNDYRWTMYRGVLVNGGAAGLLFCAALVLYAFMFGGPVFDRLNTGNYLLQTLIAVLTALIGIHWKFRKDERVAAVAPAPVIAPAVVPVATPAKPVKR